jgi:hypothetical protein
MRKPSSQQVIDKFKRRLLKSLAGHQELMIATYNSRNQAALETMLVEQFVMSSAVLWEAFLNDLIITYVVMSPDVYLKSLKSRIGVSVEDKFGGEASKYVKFSMPKSLTRSKAVGLIDPKKFNVTVSNTQTLISRVNNLLAAKYAKRFSFNAEDSAFINYAICMRNYLGHRSESARESLKESVSELTGDDKARFGGRIKEIGPYLKGKTATNDTRAIAIARRLIQIADKL